MNVYFSHESMKSDDKNMSHTKPSFREIAAITAAGYMALLPALLCVIGAMAAISILIRLYLM